MMEHDDYLAMHSVAHHVERKIVDYYNRIIVGVEIIHCLTYHHETKRNSRTVCVRTDSSFFTVKTFIVVDVESGHKCYAIGHLFEEGKHSLSTIVKNPPHFFPVEKELGHLTDKSASEIGNKCLFMPLQEKRTDYIITFLNHYEMTV